MRLNQIKVFHSMIVSSLVNTIEVPSVCTFALGVFKMRFKAVLLPGPCELGTVASSPVSTVLSVSVDKMFKWPLGAISTDFNTDCNLECL